MKTKTTSQQFGAFIGVDLGDKKHHVCVTDKDGKILEEFTIANTREALQELAASHPKAQVAIEVGTHSPWISRLLTAEGMKVTVANARKLRAIYQNDRKCDQLDARMLAKLLRADPDLLSPIKHGSEAQKDLLAIKVRDSLVRQRVHIIVTIRGLLKSIGLRLPATSTGSFHQKSREVLVEAGTDRRQGEPICPELAKPLSRCPPLPCRCWNGGRRHDPPTPPPTPRLRRSRRLRRTSVRHEHDAGLRAEARRAKE